MTVRSIRGRGHAVTRWALLSWLVLCPGPALAVAVAGTVTGLEGAAEFAANNGPWTALAIGKTLAEGSKVRTATASRLEIRLVEGSMVRLGSGTELQLTGVSGSAKKGDRQVELGLRIGRIWAAVTKAIGPKAKFEIKTENAVAGVRGTRFAVGVEPTGAGTVKVYSGKVLVSNKPIYAIEGHTKANRVPVPGPQVVDRKQWEELVAGAMQEVRIAADGRLTPSATFAMASDGEDAAWESWNAARDAAAGITE